MTAVTAPEGFTIGGVISRTLFIVARQYPRFLLLSALMVGVPGAIQGAAQLFFLGAAHTAGVSPNPFEIFTSSTNFIVWLAALLLTVAGFGALQGAVIHASIDETARVSLSDALSTGLRFCLPLVGLSLIIGFGVGFGLLLLIVPGVLLGLAWSVAAPVEVVERSGVFNALARSRELTRNHRGAIFGLWLIFGIASLVFQTVVSLLLTAAFGVGLGAVNFQAVTTHLQAAQIVSNLIVQVLIGSIGSVGAASIYFELRRVKEGVGVNQIAEVFS
jgi:hypothetical protein